MKQDCASKSVFVSESASHSLNPLNTVVFCFRRSVSCFQLVIPLREALDKFYRSQIYKEMRDGISDMHCRSEKYLAEELMQEFEA